MYAGAGVGGFFRQQQAEAAATHWQLIQLAPTDQPGQSAAETMMKVRPWMKTDSRCFVGTVVMPTTPET